MTPFVGPLYHPISKIRVTCANVLVGTQTDHSIIKDGFRSFPSGHSSSSWGGLFYLSLYFAGRLRFLDHRGEVWKAFIVLVPTLGAALIAISRIEDARHHPFDVITGSMLGALCAYVAYRQYFPPLSDVWRKGRAYPIRSWGTEPLAPSGERGADEMARDQGREPMRSAPLPVASDVRFPPGPTAYPGARPASPEDANVFRERLAANDRMRGQTTSPPGLPRIDVPPPLPPGVAHERPTVAHAPAAARGSVQPRSWEASSEEEEPESFEMTSGYRATATRDQSPAQMAGAYASPPKMPPGEV